MVIRNAVVERVNLTGGVTTLQGESGAVTLTSSGGTVTITTPTASTINLEAAGGGVTSVSNSNGTLTISPTTGAVVASLALGHANTWTGQQTFNTASTIFGVAPTFGTLTTNGGIFYGNGTGVLQQTGAGSSTTILHGGTSPAYSAVSLTADITGTLAVGNGGSGTATTFTAGSVIFAGASGVYSQNNSKFFWNNSTNRLAIGWNTTTLGTLTVIQAADASTGGICVADTTITNGLFMWVDSSAKAHIQSGDGTGILLLNTSGLVGINSATPGAQVQITTANNTTKGLLIKTASGVATSVYALEVQDSGSVFQSIIRPDGSFYCNGPASNTVFNGNGSTGNYSFAGGQGYWALRTGASFDFNVDTYNTSGAGRNSFKITRDGAASIPGTLTIGTPPTYSVSNVTTDRTYDANATTVDELADVLGTLIADFRAMGPVL